MAFIYAGQYTEALLATGASGATLLPALPVHVYTVGTTTGVTLYTSRTKGTTTANPVTTDGNGNVTFYVDPGQYDIVFTPVGGSLKRITVTVPADPAEASGTYVPKLAPHANYGSPPLGSKLDPNQLTAPNGAKLSSIITYVGGNSEVVEPSVYYNPNRWNGFEFWMAAGPYEGSSNLVENPSIWCSHDGQTWQVPPGATNPVVTPTNGTFDDPHLFELNGTMYLTWNWAQQSPAPALAVVITSTDGVTWTPLAQATTVATSASSAANETASPHLAYYDGQWYLWCLSVLGGVPNSITLRTAATIAGLNAATVTTCTVSVPAGLMHWEFEVKRVGSEWWMLQCLQASGGGSGRLYLRTSGDGVTWNLPTNPLLSGSTGSGFDNNQIYKATFVPYIDGRIGIWYSALSQANLWAIGYTTARATLTSDKILVLPQDMVTDVGTPTILSAGNGRTVAMTFDPTTLEQVHTTVRFPPSWATYNLTYLWSNESAGTGNVVWSWKESTVSPTGSLAAGDIDHGAVTFAAGAQYVLTSSRIVSAQTVPASGYLNVRLLRRAADAGDTFAADAYLVGALFERVT